MQKYEETPGALKNVKVYVRILPLLKRCKNCAKISLDKKKIYVRRLQDARPEKGTQPKDPLYWSFLTDGIFYYNSQEEIYREIMSEIIDKVLDGANFVLVSCGQTGSGKSFTTQALRSNWEHRGLVPRLVADLMLEKERRKRTNKIQYCLSYLEFRGKKFKDLLNPNFENSHSSISRDVFKSVSKVSVKDEKVALRYIFEAESRRDLAGSSEYSVCHLGTAVLTFHVYNTSLITSWAVVSAATIHIVEMAGIDNAGKSSCSKSARDLIAANSTKLELERYFENLQKIEKIPSTFARSSSYLLKYLGDVLSLNSIVRFIGHVRVAKEDLDVSLSTLRFVGKMAKVPVAKVTYDVRPQSAIYLENLRDEIERLKRELYANEMFLNQEALMNVSAKRVQQMRNDFLDFLNGRISDIDLVSLSQTQIITGIMKELYVRITAEREDALKDAERCKTALTNATRIISKTNVQNSAKSTSRKSSDPKDRLSVTNGEFMEDFQIEKVGALDGQGITLGPGISEIPGLSGTTVTILMGKNKSTASIPTRKKFRTKSSRSYDDVENEESKAKSTDGNMKKTFERLQRRLKRLK